MRFTFSAVSDSFLVSFIYLFTDTRTHARAIYIHIYILSRLSPARGGRDGDGGGSRRTQESNYVAEPVQFVAIHNVFQTRSEIYLYIYIVYARVCVCLRARAYKTRNEKSDPTNSSLLIRPVTKIALSLSRAFSSPPPCPSRRPPTFLAADATFVILFIIIKIIYIFFFFLIFPVVAILCIHSRAYVCLRPHYPSSCAFSQRGTIVSVHTQGVF